MLNISRAAFLYILRDFLVNMAVYIGPIILISLLFPLLESLPSILLIKLRLFNLNSWGKDSLVFGGLWDTVLALFLCLSERYLDSKQIDKRIIIFLLAYHLIHQP